MTIILFLIDTSGSMNQRTHSGAKPTLLDITKETVERFIKVRQRDVASRGDRYMLLTFDDAPHNIKAGWKETHNVFMNELKNLTATGLTTINTALKNCFDYLNINRMQTGIDTYGMGRCPYYLESAIIILITDGSKYSTANNVQEDLTIPPSHCPGSEFTNEPYRWDQRLFSIVLRLSGIYKSDQQNGVTSVPCDNSPINSLCETTGGRSFCVTSKSEINWSLDYLVSRMQNGVMVKFDKFGPDPPMIIPNGEENDKNTAYDLSNRSWQNTRNMILVRPSHKGYSVGNWPIPESFWPDLNIPTLVPRSAHPVIKFTCTNSEPTVIDGLPFDKYELDSSPLTNFILARKQPNVAWQVFVANSQRNSELGQPFGYLKASTNLTCVNLFVLPYNYPMLLPLLEELFKSLSGKPNREWRQQFDNYLKGMPMYYSQPLRRALQRMGATINLIPENLDAYSTVTLNNIIKKHKTLAKNEFDKLTSLMGQHKPINIEWPRISSNYFTSMNLNRKIISELFCSNPSLKRTFSRTPYEFQDINGFIVRYKEKPNSENKTSLFRNPADVPRHELLNHASKLAQIFFQKNKPLSRCLEEDQMFNLPVSQMGNYQEYLKKKPPPLREIEAPPTRQHMFGNPFKLDKKNLMMIDEADIDLVAGNQTRGMKRSAEMFGAPKPKRKPGPLPKDYSYSRSRSPSPSPPHMMYNHNQPISPGGPPSSPYLQHGSSLSHQPPQSNLYYGNYHTNPMYNNAAGSGPNLTANNGNPQPQKLIHANFSNATVPTVSGNNNLMKGIAPVRTDNKTFLHQAPINNLPQVPNKIMENSDNNFHRLVGLNSHNELNSSHLMNKSHRSAPTPMMMNNSKPLPAMTNGTFSPANCSNNNAVPITVSKVTTVSMVNGTQEKTFLDPRKGLVLNKEELEEVKKTLHFVRMKDQRKLYEMIKSHKGVFSDYLLYQAVFGAQRFGMKPMIAFLSDHFGSKVHWALESCCTVKEEPKRLPCVAVPKVT